MPTFHIRAILLGVAIECRSFETMLEAFLSSANLVMMGLSGEERFKTVLEAFLSSRLWSTSPLYAVAISLTADISAPQ
jgi:hypothetical protein